MTEVLDTPGAGMHVFTGPNFNLNCYSDAKYRIGAQRFIFGNLEVPIKIEVLNDEGNWQQHPVVFVHYGSNDARKNGEGQLVIFLMEGRYTSRPYNPFVDNELLKAAEKIGLTRGSRAGIKQLIREED